jgi:hypothetical protein
MKEGEVRLDAGYLAHPSFVDADELKAITRPLSISAAGKSGMRSPFSLYKFSNALHPWPPRDGQYLYNSQTTRG